MEIWVILNHKTIKIIFVDFNLVLKYNIKNPTYHVV